MQLCILDIERDTHHSMASWVLTITFTVDVAICLVQHFRVMLFDNVSNIGGAAITQLQSVQIENLMVFAVLEKVFPHKLDEQFTNICFHILAIWRVAPYDLPVSIPSSVLKIAIIVRH